MSQASLIDYIEQLVRISSIGAKQNIKKLQQNREKYCQFILLFVIMVLIKDI